MSFSSTIKNEISRIENMEDSSMKAELKAIFLAGAAVGKEGEINITTENAAFARRTYSLLKEISSVSSKVKCRKGKRLTKNITYELKICQPEEIEKIMGLLEIEIRENKELGRRLFFQKENGSVEKDLCKKAFLRGIFLAAGSVSDPEKTYHMELMSKTLYLAQIISEVIFGFKLNSKILKRKNYYIVYIKEGDHIVDFLNIIGAHQALLKMENIRILKDVRNNVNRLVNCDTANLGKTVNAAIRQKKYIEFIEKEIGFDNIPKNLREIAELRMKYPSDNLKELGEKLEPPLGKSGVNHRFKKLEDIAQKGLEKRN